jgi:HEAT repeat protein
MAVTLEQVIEALSFIEPPGYDEAVKLGPDIIPHLDTLVKADDPIIASKAAYVSSLIKHDKSIEILKTAAQSKYPEVRIAAASGSKNLNSEKMNDVLSLLKDDEDVGVRKQLMKSSKFTG